MCGIAGLKYSNLLQDNNLDEARDIIKKIVLHQNDRGPDDNGFWENQKIFLGHNRLSIIDLTKNGSQPIESKSWVLTYNGEIYNFLDIKSDLISKGYSFKSTSDTEVLLMSLEEYGLEKTLERINGIFSFGAYNKVEDTLFLVRDRLGVKPLFYYTDDNKIIFASSPAAIVKSMFPKKWKLNYDAIYGFFLLGAPITEETLFKGIKRLDASKVLEYKEGIKSIKTYWTPKPRQDDIEELITDAVHKQLVSDAPLVIFLSGGVDSTLVTALSKKKQDVKAFHLKSPEEEYAKLVANKLKIDLKIVDPNTVDVNEVIRKYVLSSGEPSMASMIPSIVCQEISKIAKVAISANGADELFFGYPRIPTPNRNKNFFSNQQINSDTVPSAESDEEQIGSIFRDPVNIEIKKSDLFNSIMEQFIGGGVIHSNIKRHWMAEVLNFNLSDLNHPLNYSVLKNNGFDDPTTFNRWFELSTYIKSDLNPTLDFASMSNSLEVRVPFLDHRVVERALTLSDKEHINEQYSRKAILKKMLNDLNIPSEIWRRPKVGFSLATDFSNKLSLDRTRSLVSLHERNILSFPIMRYRSNSQSPNLLKNSSYIANCALSLESWCKEWIDGGYIEE